MMAGILNEEAPAAPDQAAQGPGDTPDMAKMADPSVKAPKLADPLLQKIDAQVEAKVPQQLRQQYNAIIVASESIMYSPKTRQFIQQRMESSPDMGRNVAMGVADLIIMVFQQSGQMKDPVRTQQFFDASMLACVPLMCNCLDLAEQLGRVQLTSKMIGDCTKMTYKETMKRFGVTDKMVQEAVKQGVQKVKPQLKKGK